MIRQIPDRTVHSPRYRVNGDIGILFGVSSILFVQYRFPLENDSYELSRGVVQRTRELQNLLTNPVLRNASSTIAPLLAAAEAVAHIARRIGFAPVRTRAPAHADFQNRRGRRGSLEIQADADTHARR